MFVANYIRLAHDAYEEWLTLAGIEIIDCLKGDQPILPIVHIDADFFRPVQAGDTLRIQILALQSGAKSFETQYQFFRGGEDPVAEVRMKHVAVNQRTGQSVELPTALTDLL